MPDVGPIASDTQIGKFVSLLQSLNHLLSPLNKAYLGFPRQGILCDPVTINILIGFALRFFPLPLYR